MQILIRPVTINSPHAFVNDLATKKPTSEELKRYYEDKDYSNWLNRSLSLMRQKFLDLTKKGEVAGLVRRDHQEKQASEIYPNITLIKTNRDQNFEFVFFKENSYPSLSDQEWFYQIFFSFNQN